VAEQPTLLFGVGATKAGTGWLHDYLVRHDQCHMRSLKELHYFDACDLDGAGFHLRSLADKRAAARRGLARTDAAADPARAARLAARVADCDELIAVVEGGAAAVPAYLDYLTRGAGAARLVADITPAYALLSVERLRMMAALAPVTRFVYLLRDPVERLWSHIRMNTARGLKEGEDFAGRAARLLRRLIAGKGAADIRARGDYAAAIGRLQAAVPARALMIDLSERVLSDAGLHRLCRFLGIAHRDGQTGQRVHEGLSLTMTEAQRRTAASFLAPQYEFVEKMFGPLPASWQANMAKV